MNRKKIILIVALFVMIVSVAVEAAFIFSRSFGDDKAEPGQIRVDSKAFISYQDPDNIDMRIDTLLKASSARMTSEETYPFTTDSIFQSNTSYYVEGTYKKLELSTGELVPQASYEDIDGEFRLTSSSVVKLGDVFYEKISDSGYTQTLSYKVGTIIKENTYHVRLVTYTGLTSFDSFVNKEGASLSYTISNGKTIEVINGADTFIITLEFSTKGISKVSTNISYYHCAVNSLNNGFTIIDKRIEVDENQIIRQDKITCNATESRLDDNKNIFLNQLGFEFSFTNEIPVYARINIQDAWISTKVYATNVRENYSIKDQIEGNTPFAINDDNWVYNPSDNCLYYKSMIMPKRNANGEFESVTFSFMINEAYFLEQNGSHTYKEYVTVEVSFGIDLVQANRVYEVWQLDPTLMGGGANEKN